MKKEKGKLAPSFIILIFINSILISLNTIIKDSEWLKILIMCLSISVAIALIVFSVIIIRDEKTKNKII